MAAACESIAADNVFRPVLLGKPNSAEYDYYDDFSLQFARDLF